MGGNCGISRGVHIGPGVYVGDRCKVENYALQCEPAFLEERVFVRPAVIRTHDQYPRAITPEGSAKSGDDWKPVGPSLRRGAPVGAWPACVAPVTIGAWAKHMTYAGQMPLQVQATKKEC